MKIPGSPVIAINTLSVFGERLGGGYTYLRNLLPPLVAAAPQARFRLLVTGANWRTFIEGNPRVTYTMLSDLALRGGVRTLIERGGVTRWLTRIGADLYFVPYGWLPDDAPCPTVWTFQNLLLLESAEHQRTTPRYLLSRMRERVRCGLVAKRLLPATVEADRIIAVSEIAKRRLAAEYPTSHERIVVIPEGVEDRFRRAGDPVADSMVAARYRLHEPYVLSVSTLMRHKRHETLIRAYADARRRTCSSALLVIAGSDWGGYRRTLDRVVAEVGGESSVRFLGHVPPADLPALYRRAVMFALLSTCEAFGLPALEAMACGCPTVVPNTGGLAEVVADGGLLVDPDDDDGLVRVLADLLASPDLRAGLSRAARLRAAQFSWAKAGRQTAAVFEDLLAGHAATTDRHARMEDALTEVVGA